jgi:hypothetical protein
LTLAELATLTPAQILVLQRLLVHFTWEQLEMVARECDRSRERGLFWQLTLVFENGHPRFIQPAPSLELPKPPASLHNDSQAREK